MANSASKPCACGCNPCACVPPGIGDGGCLPEFCTERPCFFDGQLINADDLNAVVRYFRTQDAILSRLLGGWGVLGGLRVDAVSGIQRRLLGTGTLAQLTPNPQIIAGTSITVSAGVAVDSFGRKLSLCQSVTLDVQALARLTPEGTVKVESCGSLLGPFCGSHAGEQLLVSEFFLIAERTETSSRPAPRFSGGGPCDPAPTCDFSRLVEEIRFSLIPCLPAAYQFTGCLDDTNFQLPQVNLGQEQDADLCRAEVLAFIDNVQGQIATQCCARPAVVLARIILTRDPKSLWSEAPFTPLYTIITDGYPCRRPIFQPALFTKFFPNLICATA